MKLLLQFVFLISISCFSQETKEFVIQFKTSIPSNNISNTLRQYPNIKNWRVLNTNKDHPLYNTVKFKSNSFDPQSLSQNPNIDYIEELPQTFLALDTVPSDPYFPFQWEIDFMNTQKVWADLENNDSTLLVAIVDSGSDFDNDDLKRVYNNPNETDNGLDDDDNTFIDDIVGWDFGEYDNNPSVTSIERHGSRMTSLVASATNNGFGISSLSYNVEYLTAKITQDDGSLVDPYEGVTYAIDQGAKVINCSWYQNTSTKYSKKVVDYAAEKGVFLVAAAGNENNSIPVYPASDPSVLGVGALKEDITKTSSSNFGSWVDIFAPGSGIYVAEANSTYSKTSGTSVACAVMSSACSLLKKRFPEESPRQLIDRIKRTGTPFTDQNIQGNYINLYKATQNIEYADIEIFPNPIIDNQFTITIPSHIERGLITLDVYNTLGQIVFQKQVELLENENIINTTANLNPGQYFLKLKSKNVSKTSILTFAP